jgi:hypothetical protein
LGRFLALVAREAAPNKASASGMEIATSNTLLVFDGSP